MKIKFVVRNKDKVEDNAVSKIIEMAYLPPIDMVFCFPGLDEAKVDSHYCDTTDGFDAEVWLHTDDDEGIENLKKNGWKDESAE